MCNDYGNHIPYSAYLEAFSETRIPVRFPIAAPNLQPREDIWPTDTAPVIRQAEDGVEFTQLRWGFPPARPKGAPVINFRSEGRRFPKGRCLVPASHFFEFTGAKSPKSKWKFTKAGEGWFCFAGLWRPMPDGAGDAFTLLTTEPGPDVAPIHNRADGRAGAFRLARVA
jgi:putative SOS response-associated peptidase YedK